MWKDNIVEENVAKLKKIHRNNNASDIFTKVVPQ